MKFQALGSNYSFGWSLRQLFAVGRERDSRQLDQALEQRYTGKPYLYARGRYALSEAVRLAAGARDNPKIAVNALTCSVVVEAIQAAGATAYFLDVNPDTAHFGTDQLTAALDAEPTICAVIVQNTYGRTVDIEPIETLAHKHSLTLIEDLAHSAGLVYPDGRQTGTVGDLAMLSFGRDKSLDVVNGGALIVRKTELLPEVEIPLSWPRMIDQLRDRIYPILTWLVRRTYAFGLGKLILIGMYRLGLATRSSDGGINRSHRLPNWQAKLAGHRLQSVDQINLQRQERMDDYQTYIGDELISRGGTVRGAVAVNNRSDVLHNLRQAGYELKDTWYDTPIGPARKYDVSQYPVERCSRAVELSQKLINLPTHDEVSSTDIQKIAEIVRRS